MILNKLGVFGWKEADENLVLATLLTGDPLLLIGNHGCAKTHVAGKVAQALSRKSLVYDASKAMFEDVLGYPNLEKLKHGAVEYVPSPVTIWDKELVLIDELNRAVPELQSKWLEIIRSRKIMGFDTEVKWVWAAMNPTSYSATNALDEALVGRFALFLYPPDVLQMEEEDRIRVALHINGDDAPALRFWVGEQSTATVSQADAEQAGNDLRRVLEQAGTYFLRLKTQLSTLGEFLARFADLLLRESKGEVVIDGRRLGFIHRNILANRAVEMAKAEILGSTLPGFIESARYAVQSSVPVGLNDASLNREKAVHQMEICFDLLSSYFEANAEIGKVNLIYELFSTGDLLRKAELLLSEDLGELAHTKAWSDLVKENQDLTLLVYTALQVEARRPGTVPQELLASLSAKIKPENLSVECIPTLFGDAVEYIEEVEALLEHKEELHRMLAFQRVKALVKSKKVTPKAIERTRRKIRQDIETFEGLVNGAREKGGQAA